MRRKERRLEEDEMTETAFSKLSDDVILNIFFKLEFDPRNWARLSCVCTKFSSLIRTVCYRIKCSQTIPALVSDLHPSSSAAGTTASSWASLHKLAVCCPGLHHAGVLLENSDFGLERELGPDQSDPQTYLPQNNSTPPSSIHIDRNCDKSTGSSSECYWSLFDDLYFDTVYNVTDTYDGIQAGDEVDKGLIKAGGEFSVSKKRKICRPLRSHLASGVWNLSREQGNKLLASRFRGDCLYICDWPGCVHIEEKRSYMLFRGVFKNFKRTRVWRTINDGNRSKVDLNCAFCPCKETWDLHSAFCLRRVFGFHDDGEPVVRAYVCENGHVSGAWTDWPLYT